MSDSSALQSMVAMRKSLPPVLPATVLASFEEEGFEPADGAQQEFRSIEVEGGFSVFMA